MLADSEAPAVARKRKFDTDRSDITRLKLFRGTIDCLTDFGFAATTTALVARIAGVSRGAMVHQFPTKADLMLATFEYCVAEAARRNRELAKNYATAKERFFALPRMAWTVSTEPWAIAMCEMEFGSRSDREFTRLFAPVAGELQTLRVERAWERTAVEAGLTNLAEVRDLAVFHLGAIRGLMMIRLTSPDNVVKVERGFDILERQATTMIAAWFEAI